MSQPLRVGVLGAGPAGLAHARGFAAAGGYRVEAVTDLIPARVEGFRKEFTAARAVDTAEQLVKDAGLDVVAVCLPTDLHALYAVKALKAGKHVVVEVPIAPDARSARAMIRAAEKSGKVLLPAFPRVFGLHEAAARQAVEKGFLGSVYHARATWLRPAHIPQGSKDPGAPGGWYTDPARSGGGALLDLGLPMLHLAHQLLGSPKPLGVFAAAHHDLAHLAVEEAASLLVRFEGNKSLELCVAWTVHAPPHTFGLTCRLHGTGGSLDVYTPHGATLHRATPPRTTPLGKAAPASKPILLKGPKVTQFPALFRHFKTLIAAEPAARLAPAAHALLLTHVLEAAYKSAKTGKSAEVKDG